MKIDKTDFSYQDKRENIPRMSAMALRGILDWAAILTQPEKSYNQPLWSKFFYLLVQMRKAENYEKFIPVLESLFYYTQNGYTLEEGEQFLRPGYFYAVGGDCDDQVIFVLSFLKWLGYHENEIWIVEGSLDAMDYTHIFLKIQFFDEIIYLDPLPGNQFGYTQPSAKREWRVDQL